MHQHRLVAVQRQQQELAAPPQPTKPAPRQARRKILRQRPAQVGPADMGIGDTVVLERRHQRPADGFNFGKLGHD